jgi:hypothetical protein
MEVGVLADSLASRGRASISDSVVCQDFTNLGGKPS